MTGGLGFSRTAQNSVKQNKDLKNSRSRMKDNPYAATNKINRQHTLLNYYKLKAWMNDKTENEKKTRRIIFLLLFTTLLLFLTMINMIIQP